MVAQLQGPLFLLTFRSLPLRAQQRVRHIQGVSLPPEPEPSMRGRFVSMSPKPYTGPGKRKRDDDDDDDDNRDNKVLTICQATI